MQVLSAELANRLQYVTVLFELVGLTLAFIEIRFPKLALSVSKHIRHEIKDLGRSVSSLSRGRLLEVLIGLVLGLILLYALDTWGSPFIALTLLFVFLALILSYTIAAYWIPQRAIGGFGIALASFGVLGEIYQIIVSKIAGS
jgi:uncharacterized protein YacL